MLSGKIKTISTSLKYGLVFNESLTSASINSTSFIDSPKLSAEPEDKLSIIRTLAPYERRSSDKWLPINDAPPVISTFFWIKFHLINYNSINKNYWLKSLFPTTFKEILLISFLSWKI